MYSTHRHTHTEHSASTLTLWLFSGSPDMHQRLPGLEAQLTPESIDALIPIFSERCIKLQAGSRDAPFMVTCDSSMEPKLDQSPFVRMNSPPGRVKRFTRLGKCCPRPSQHVLTVKAIIDSHPTDMDIFAPWPADLDGKMAQKTQPSMGFLPS